MAPGAYVASGGRGGVGWRVRGRVGDVWWRWQGGCGIGGGGGVVGWVVVVVGGGPRFVYNSTYSN